MNRYFYYLLNNNNDIIGYVTSFDLRYINPKNQRLLCCKEDLAQYVMYNNQLYRTYTFNNVTNPQDKDFEEVSVILTTEEEYMKQKENENLV